MTQLLMDAATPIAERDYDGHMTLLRFTTGWKVCFGTAEIPHDREWLLRQPAFGSLDDALRHLVVNRPSAYDDERTRT
jgi:hypothetical protein